MGSKTRKIIGIVLLAVYAFFFASTHFFVHSHQFADTRIVHSHAGKAVGHTANQIQLISAICNTVYENSDDVAAPQYCAATLCEIILPAVGCELTAVAALVLSLRAPPSSDMTLC